MLDPNMEDQVDENQNNVWNVDLGLTNLGYLSYMKKMGVLLVLKKKLDRKLNDLKGKQEECAQKCHDRQVEPTNDSGYIRFEKLIVKVQAEIKEM